MKELLVRPKTIKLLEKKNTMKLCDVDIGNDTKSVNNSKINK